MKKAKFNSFIILVISGIFIYYLLKDNFKQSMDLLITAKFAWLFLAATLFFLYVLFEAYALYLLAKEYKKDYPFWKTLCLQFMTKFFNGITPFASGGQPLQVYELHKEGLTYVQATSVIVENFIIFQTSIVIMGIAAVIANFFFDFFVENYMMKIFVLFGFTVNLLLLLVVLAVSINPKISQKVINWLCSFLHKIKILKDKNKTNKKINNFFKDYIKAFAELRKNKKLVVKTIGLVMIAMISYFLIPQCVFNALKIKHELSFLITIVTGIYIFIMSSFVPIPGGTGGVEFGFLVFFENFVPNPLIPPALILWRFITYYVPILVGGIIYNFFSEKRIEERKKQPA